MTDYPTPRRIEWTGPEGFTVWADEDGVHVRSRSGDALEQPDMQRLVDLWSLAIQATRNGDIPSPKPPTRDEIREQGYARAEEATKRRIARAIAAEFDTAPF